PHQHRGHEEGGPGDGPAALWLREPGTGRPALPDGRELHRRRRLPLRDPELVAAPATRPLAPAEAGRLLRALRRAAVGAAGAHRGRPAAKVAPEDTPHRPPAVRGARRLTPAARPRLRPPRPAWWRPEPCRPRSRPPSPRA